jgi:hypothetical protein
MPSNLLLSLSKPRFNIFIEKEQKKKKNNFKNIQMYLKFFIYTISKGFPITFHTLGIRSF